MQKTNAKILVGLSSLGYLSTLVALNTLPPSAKVELVVGLALVCTLSVMFWVVALIRLDLLTDGAVFRVFGHLAERLGGKEVHELEDELAPNEL